MGTLNSFNRYGKFDELEETEFRRKTRRRVIIVTISALILIILVVGVVAGTLVHKKKPTNFSSRAAAIKSVCSVTQYPNSCFSSLEPSNSTRPENLFQYSLTVAMDSLVNVSKFPDEYSKQKDDPFVKAALKVCSIVLNDAFSSLNDSIVAAAGDVVSRIDDVKTWLSAAVTDQETCFDALEEANATFVDEIRFDLMKNSTEFASNSLAIASKLLGRFGNFENPTRRRLMREEGLNFPAWVAAGERRMLQESRPRPNVTVAADGTGDVETVNEAVAMIPKKSKSRFVIHIKAGEYIENVALDKSYWNVMIYGDGSNSTIIAGEKNHDDGTPTFETATFAIAGKGFIARDIGFVNTAGAAKHQAVAFRSGSDQSVLYRCSFDGFQDTLYAHSNRQFYRECDITGTVDFIFGNSAALFQGCTISPRQPQPGQFVTITAQGKSDPNQNTGISIQGCTMAPLDNLTAATYLGRPWKDYSTTVVMESEVGGFLDPKGWSPWEENVDPPGSIFYGEYRNTGPGARTGGRVTWPGYKPGLTAGQAEKYSVRSFIQGSTWLPETNVDFDSN